MAGHKNRFKFTDTHSYWLRLAVFSTEYAWAGGEESSEHEVTSMESPDQQPMGGEGGITGMGKGGTYSDIFI